MFAHDTIGLSGTSATLMSTNQPQGCAPIYPVNFVEKVVVIHRGDDLHRKYGRTAPRLIRRHERCSSKLARYINHLTFLSRCIKNRVVPKDLRVRPPVPTKGARRVAELASMRFLRERIRLTQKAKGDAKKDTESTAQSITSALSTNDANRILE